MRDDGRSVCCVRSLAFAAGLAAACSPRAAVDPGPALQIVGDAAALRVGDPVPASSPLFDGTTLRLRAVRGEVLGFGVLHREPGASSLVLQGDGPRVQGFSTRLVHVARASTDMFGPSRGTGDYPDELVPDAAPTTSPAWFDVSVAATAATGIHRGSLTVGARTIVVELTVESPVLPPVGDAPLVWAFGRTDEFRWSLGASTDADAASLEQRCATTFRGYGVALAPELKLDDPTPRDALVRGLPAVPIWLPDDATGIARDVPRWLAALPAGGPPAFAIPIDEPRDAAARARVRALGEAIDQAGGGERVLLAVTDGPHADYGTAVDVTIAPRAVERGGDHARSWTYNGKPPMAGSLIVDGAAGALRTWGWIAWRWDVPLWYVWDALYWHDRHNPTTSPMPGRVLDVAHDAASFDDGDDRGNLDGVLALPGDAALPCHPTLRLASLRRGLIDRQLLTAVTACGGAAARQAAAIAARMIPTALGDAPPSGEPSWPSTADDAAWDHARQELIDLLVGCSRR